MTAAVVALAIALAGALAAIVYLLRRQQTSLDAEVAAGKQQVADDLALHEAERQRDEAITARAIAEKKSADARSALAETQAALNAARKEKAEYVVQQIRCADSTAAALQHLDELWSHVPGMSAERPSTGGSDGGGGAPAVQPASVAE